MGGAIDLKAGSRSLTGQNLFKVNKSPLDQFNEGVDDVIGKAAGNTSNMFMALVGGVFSDLASVITNIPNEFTGLIAQALPEMAGQVLNVGGWFTDLESLLGAPTGLGTGSPTLPGIGSIPLLGGLLSGGGASFLASLIPGLDATKIVSGQFPLAMISGLLDSSGQIVGSLLGNAGAAAMDFISLVESFIPGYTGTTQSQAQTDLASVEQNLLGLLGHPTNMLTTPVLPGIGSIPVLGGLLSGGGSTFLSSLIPGLDASKIISGSFPQSMITGLASLLSGFGSGSSIISQLIALWPNQAGGLTGLTGLSSIYGDVLGLLGHPTSLGSGSPVLPGIGSIPLLGGLLSGGGASFLSSLIPGLDASKIISGQFPQSMVQNLVSDLANAGNNFAQLVQSFIPGMSTGTQTDFTNIAQNILGMLGNPTGINSATTSFNPVVMGQQMLTNVLTPAGALSSFTQLPGHLFGVLAPNNITNMLPDPGFDNSSFFDNQSFWDGTVGRTVNSTIVGSLKFTANGSYQQYVGVPIGADASQVIQLGIYAYWQNLVANAGNAIVLAADAYDANDNLIANPTGRIIMAIAHPSTNSSTYAGEGTQPPVPAQGTAGWDGTGTPGWVYLSGAYMPPAGTSYVRISPEITANTISGTVNFDDGYLMPESGFLDSAVLGNFNNLLDGAIPGVKVGGLQGIADIMGAFQHHVDGLFNAMNDGSPQTNVPFSTLFDMMQTTALNAGNANTLGATNNNIITNQISKPAITGGTQPSGEANATHATMPDTTTLPTTTLATGQAIAGWIRVGQNASKGFVDFLAAKAAAGTTGIYMNLYKQNTSTGTKTRVYASPDLASLLPASTTAIASVSQMLIPGGVAVSQGDVLWAELVNLSGSNLLVGKKSSPFPDHSSTYPRNFGHTRTVATLGQSPATLTSTDTTTSQTAPIFNTGIASVPANYHLPQQNSWPPSGSGAGTYVYNIPAFITTGDLIDLIGVGGGGSGMSEWDAGIMAGGVGGSWGAQQFVYGSDINGTGLTVIPAGTTQINVVVGVGGPQCNGYWQNGNPGGATQFWIGPVGTGTLLLSCAGGPGGSGSVGLSNGTGSGPTPQTEVFDGKSYPGGADVGINSPGAAPGGGGGGATWYEFGGRGAVGGAWAYAQKAPSS